MTDLHTEAKNFLKWRSKERRMRRQRSKLHQRREGTFDRQTECAANISAVDVTIKLRECGSNLARDVPVWDW